MRLPTKMICVLAVSAALSCDDDPVVPPPGHDPIRDFVDSENLPLLRNIGIDVSLPDQALVFFHASYGEPHDCPSGCFYSTAFGVKLRSKLGWIGFAHYEQVALDSVTYFSVEPDDVALFEESTWEALGTRWVLWGALLPYLAEHERCPEDVLIRIAIRLYDYISPRVAARLLANPAITSHPDVLQLLACLPGSGTDVYARYRMQARVLLGDAFVTCAR